MSAKYWNRLPLATPARRAMTFRLPPENPCAPNSASAASMIAARRAGSTRAHVTVGMQPPCVDDQWSFYCDRHHSQGGQLTTLQLRTRHAAAGVRGCSLGATQLSVTTASRAHLVRAVERQHVFLPDLVVAAAVVDRAPDHPHRETRLLVRRRRLVVQFDGIGVEVAHQQGEDLVEQRLVRRRESGASSRMSCA